MNDFSLNGGAETVELGTSIRSQTNSPSQIPRSYPCLNTRQAQLPHGHRGSLLRPERDFVCLALVQMYKHCASLQGSGELNRHWRTLIDLHHKDRSCPRRNTCFNVHNRIASSSLDT